MQRLITLLISFALVNAYAYPSIDNIDNNYHNYQAGAGSSSAASKEESSLTSLDGVYKIVQECGERDLTICLKMRALTYVDKALRKSEDVKIVDGVTLVVNKDDANNEAYRGLNGRALSQDELDASLPKNEDDRNAQVENMLFDRVARFLEGHTLQLRVPQSSITEMKRSLDEGELEFFSLIFFFCF